MMWGSMPAGDLSRRGDLFCRHCMVAASNVPSAANIRAESRTFLNGVAGTSPWSARKKQRGEASHGDCYHQLLTPFTYGQKRHSQSHSHPREEGPTMRGGTAGATARLERPCIHALCKRSLRRCLEEEFLRASRVGRSQRAEPDGARGRCRLEKHAGEGERRVRREHRNLGKRAESRELWSEPRGQSAAGEPEGLEPSGRWTDGWNAGSGRRAVVSPIAAKEPIEPSCGSTRRTERPVAPSCGGLRKRRC